MSADEIRVGDFFLDNSSNKLVVTLGDSWTWGDSLGDLSEHYRSKHLYGRHISDHINADWYNWGGCGYSNVAIIEMLNRSIATLYPNKRILLFKDHYDAFAGQDYPNYKDYTKQISQFDKEINQSLERIKLLQNKAYKEVYFFVTITEVGRQLEYLDNNTPIDELLKKQEQTEFDILNFYKDSINLIVGRNFTKNYTSTTDFVGIEKNWIEMNYNQNIKDGFDNQYNLEDILISGNSGYLGLQQFVSHKHYKEYVINHKDRVDPLWKWLRNNPYHYKKATCHPTEESHRLWANYLLECI